MTDQICLSRLVNYELALHYWSARDCTWSPNFNLWEERHDHTRPVR